MGWLVGLAIVALALYFRRGSILLIALAALGLFVLLTNPGEDADLDRAERREDALKASERVREAREQPSDVKLWEVVGEPPPAGGSVVPRLARVVSDNDLCTLELDGPAAGRELARIYCNHLQITAKWQIDIKFDNYPEADAMAINTQYRGRTNEIRILGNQPDDVSTLAYDEFVRRLTTADAVSFKIRPDDGRWATFTLNGSEAAIAAVYGGQS